MSSTNVTVNPVDSVMESVKAMDMSDLLILQVRLASYIQKEAKALTKAKAKRVRDPSAPKKVPTAAFFACGAFVKHLKETQPELFASEKNVTKHQSIAKAYRLANADEYAAFVAKFVGDSSPVVTTPPPVVTTPPPIKITAPAVTDDEAVEKPKAKRAAPKKSKKTVDTTE